MLHFDTLKNISNILLLQHKEIFVITPQHWYAQFIQFLINTRKLSYALYLAGTIFELSCIIGFFTKKYDIFAQNLITG